MAKGRMSLPHERRKAKLQATHINLRVRLAETREHLQRVKQELAAMKPAKPKPQGSL